ncbi:kinase-like protein [Pholiota conissans]|uniref:Kinase-like protein n=1 Tax=Pholiota conissans TaxID=109636 RepID=A0A9P5ZF03_9AGAR|nr:kinase-like protein [Pholiota conissans]
MFTGRPSTANDSHSPPWDAPASRSLIDVVAEVDEDDALLAFHPFPSPSRDTEQALSSRLLRSSQTFGSPACSPRPVAASNSNVSASPAAAFLSFFHSPSPAPESRDQDDESNVVAGYTLGSIIGYGSTSIIRRATSASGSIAAVKIIRRTDLVRAGNAPQARKRLQHEAAVWATLSHEHILPLFKTVHTPYADYFFTLYCPAGSLFDILKRDGTPALPQDDAGMMFRQVVRGLRYLHEVAQYVHRDIKLENVLVDEMGVCKIGDFGMCRRIGYPDSESDEDGDSPESTNSLFGLPNANVHRAVSMAAPRRQPRNNHEVNHNFPIMRYNTTRHRNSTSTEPATAHSFQPGSLPYAAPEILLPQTSESMRPHPSQDIWALGVLLYALLTGRLPFSDSFEPRLQMKILKGTYQIPEGIGRGAERILQGCLEKNIADRWTIAMVDEVSWGVGWGAEGDHAAVNREEHDDGIECPPLSTASRSKSRSRELVVSLDATINWQQDEPSPRPSAEAATRRSSSRVQRSLSRAPIPTSRPSSARRSPSQRSLSRHPRSRSRTTTLESPISASLVTASSSSSSSGVYRSIVDEYALEVSPSPPPSGQRGRGRREDQPHHSASRSRSPSVVPSTPPDAARVASPTLEPTDELHLDPQSSRGRTTIRADRPSVSLVGIPKPTLFEYLRPMDHWETDVTGTDSDALTRSDSMNSVQSTSDYVLVDDAREIGSAEPNVVSTRRRPRPTSSPPTAPRKPLGVKEGALGMLDPFMTPRAVPSSANLSTRCRSAEGGHGRR